MTEGGNFFGTILDRMIPKQMMFQMLRVRPFGTMLNRMISKFGTMLNRMIPKPCILFCIKKMVA